MLKHKEEDITSKDKVAKRRRSKSVGNLNDSPKTNLPILTRGVLNSGLELESIPEPNKADLLQAYQTLIRFEIDNTDKLNKIDTTELSAAINIIDPYFRFQPNGNIIEKSRQLFKQLPEEEYEKGGKKYKRINKEFMEKLIFDQKETFYGTVQVKKNDSLNAITNMIEGGESISAITRNSDMIKFKMVDYNMKIFVSKEFSVKSVKNEEIKSIKEDEIINAIVESVLYLDEQEKEKLKSTRTYIYVHNVNTKNVVQQATWQFDQTRNIHTGDIFLKGDKDINPMEKFLIKKKEENKVVDSMPRYIKNKKGEKEESKAIVKHELGHILHAILNPTNFRLASTMDAFNQYKSSAPPKIMQEIDKREGEEPGEKEGRWVYAKDSIRENIAEIFTALTSGVSISNEQYDWYLKHGGPRIDGRYSKENDSFEVKKIKNQNDKNKTTKKT